MDLKTGVGSLDCRLCGASYQMPIHHLHEPIDVFSEWLDDCEAAARPAPPPSSTTHHHHGGGGGADQYDDVSEDEVDIPEASGLLANNKPAAKASSRTTPAANYSALGLDDSDDDEEDEDD